jgi:hypothetical protein
MHLSLPPTVAAHIGEDAYAATGRPHSRVIRLCRRIAAAPGNLLDVLSVRV